jgi:hypothetical protein
MTLLTVGPTAQRICLEQLPLTINELRVIGLRRTGPCAIPSDMVGLGHSFGISSELAANRQACGRGRRGAWIRFVFQVPSR